MFERVKSSSSCEQAWLVWVFLTEELIFWVLVLLRTDAVSCSCLLVLTSDPRWFVFFPKLFGNIWLSMASLVIFMQLRYLFHEVQRRIRRHKNYLRVVGNMEARWAACVLWGTHCAVGRGAQTRNWGSLMFLWYMMACCELERCCLQNPALKSSCSRGVFSQSLCFHCICDEGLCLGLTDT